MIRGLNRQALLRACASVGVTFEKKADVDFIYAWVTPQDEVLYIGKAATEGRLSDEKSWATGVPNLRLARAAMNNEPVILSSFASLVATHQAAVVPLGWPRLDRAQLEAAIDAAVQKVLDAEPTLELSPPFLEKWAPQVAGFEVGRSQVALRCWFAADVEGWLSNAGTFTHKDGEKLLVRIATRAGVPIGNSQFASQWAEPIYSAADTLALLAVLLNPSLLI